jgi:hypothetical protein
MTSGEEYFSDSDPIEDDGFVHDGSAEETWTDPYEQWAEDPNTYEGDDIEAMRQELADLKAEMQNAQQPYGPSAQEIAQAQQYQRDAEFTQQLQNEQMALEHELGRPLGDAEWNALREDAEANPDRRSLKESYKAAWQDLPREQRMLARLQANQAGPVPEGHEFLPNPEDWSTDPEERSKQRQAAMLGRWSMQQGAEYEETE